MQVTGMGKAKQVKRCFNENMISKQLLVNIWCYYLQRLQTIFDASLALV